MFQFYNKAMAFSTGGPTISSTSPLLSGETNFPYTTQLFAFGGTQPYTWAQTAGTLPAGLNLLSTGVLTGTPTAANSYLFTVQVTDSQGLQSNPVQFSQTIITGVSITTASPLPNATQSNFYMTTIAASGGVTPYVWSIQSQTGTSNWVINSSTGVLSGTPPNAETDSITVQVQDALGHTPQKVFSLTVVSNYIAPTITTTSPLPSATNGQAYSFQMQEINGTPPFTWNLASGALPAGLSLSASGLISGIPTANGTTTANISLTDSHPTTVGPVAFSLTVNAAAIPVAPAQQLKFISGHILQTENYEHGTNNGSIGPNQWLTEIAAVKSSPQMIGYRPCFRSTDLEDYSQATNIALTVAGLTGAALQAKIIQQYPGFATVEKFFYTLQANVPGAAYEILINFQDQNPGKYTQATVTGNWSNGAGAPVPKDFAQAPGGAVTYPISYGSATTANATLPAIYSGSGFFGFAFSAFDGVSSFTSGNPMWWVPAVNQRQRIQLIQALSQYTLSAGAAYSGTTAYVVGNVVTSGGTSYLCIANTTGNAPPNASFWTVNTFAGLTWDQVPQFTMIGHNDEYSWAYQGGGANNFPSGPTVNPPGGNGSVASMKAAHFAFVNACRAAFPTTAFFDCLSFGSGFGDTTQQMAQMVNDFQNNGSGLSSIRGWVLSNSDCVQNDFNLNSGWTNPSATPTYAGQIGITNPPSYPAPIWPASGQINKVPATDLSPTCGFVGQYQAGDSNPSGPSPPQFAANSTAAYQAVIQSAAYMGAFRMAWMYGDFVPFPGGAYNTAIWASTMYPAITSSPFVLATALPKNWMYGPSINSAVGQSTTSILISWNAITGQGTGLNLQLYRNGAAIGTAQPAATYTSFTDTGLGTGTNYQYTLQMQNANGNGPIGPVTLGTTLPVAGQVPFAWTAPVGVTGVTYNVYQGPGNTTDGPTGPATQIQTGLITPYTTVSGLTSGTLLYFQVTSVVSGVESAKSAPIYETVP